MAEFSPTTLAASPDAGPTAAVSVDPYDLHVIAKKFIDAQPMCSEIMNTLHGKLWENREAFGQDNSVAAFEEVYINAADKVFTGFVKAHRLLGNIGNGLDTAAQNHRNAEEKSKGSGQQATTSPPPLKAEPEIAKRDVPRIRDATLPGLPEKLVPLWPSSDKGKVEAIEAAYKDAHDSLYNLVDGLHRDLQNLISNNDSEDLWAFEEYWGRVAGDDNTFFTAFLGLIQKVGASVSDYAKKIEESRTHFENAVKNAAKKIEREVGWDGGPIYADVDLSDAPVAELLTGEYEGKDQVANNAVTTLDGPARDLRNNVANSGPIKAAGAASDAFDQVMANVPEPNVEIAAATEIGDEILDPSEDVPEKPGPGGGSEPGPGHSGAPAVVAPGTTDGGVPNKDETPAESPDDVSLILGAAGTQRAAQELAKLSPADRQRFEQLLADAKSPHEQAYLKKALAAGHSVDEIVSFGNLIHEYGDDPAWLQEHLIPMANGDSQNPDFTYQGGSWTQGQYPAAVAASTVLARAMADPVYTLYLTTGNKPDDPTSTSKEAFLARLREEQQEAYDQSQQQTDNSSGNPPDTPGNTPGMLGDTDQRTASDDIGTYYGQDYERQDVSANAVDRRNILPGVARAIDEGKPVPIQVGDADGGHQLVIIGHRDNQLEIYNPRGGISWVSADDFVNGRMGNMGSGVPPHVRSVVMPRERYTAG